MSALCQKGKYFLNVFVAYSENWLNQMLKSARDCTKRYFVSSFSQSSFLAFGLKYVMLATVSLNILFFFFKALRETSTDIPLGPQ